MTDQPPSGSDANESGAGSPPPPPSSGSVPPASPVPNPGSKPTWYENVAIVVLALLCCSPLGLVFVWLNKKWTTKAKAIITGVVVAIALLGAIIGATSSSGSSNAGSGTDETATTISKASPSTTGKESSTTTSKNVAPCKDTPDASALDTKKQGLYPQRLGISKDDHEAVVGDCVRIDGMTAYVTGSRVVTPRFGDKVIVVSVTIRGRDATKNYNPFDFKLQNPAGSQESITISLDDSINELNSGSLVKGGEVTGDLVFKYAAPGTYYVVWQPNVIKSEKGFWAIDVP